MALALEGLRAMLTECVIGIGTKESQFNYFTVVDS